MIDYGAQNLQASFDTVRRNTLTIAEEIPAEQYSFRASPDTKTIAEMFAHLAVAPMWHIEATHEHLAHFDFAYFGARMAAGIAAGQALTTKDAIVKALRENGEKLSAFLGSLTEETLQETVSFPPPVQPATKTRFELLLGIKEHEMHHRAQLMLIERMIGIVPHLTRTREAFRAQAAGGGAPGGVRPRIHR